MRNKGLVIALIISVAFNIGVGVAFLIHILNPDYPYTSSYNAPPMVFRNLNLNSQQWEKLRSIKEEVFRKNYSIQSKINDLRMKIFEEMKKDKPDFNKIKELTNEIGKLKAEKEKNIIESFKELKDILTPSQCKYFFNNFSQRFLWRHHGLNIAPGAHHRGMCPGCKNPMPWHHKGKGSLMFNN